MTLKDPARSKREDLTADGTGTVYGTVVTDGDFGEMARSLLAAPIYHLREGTTSLSCS